MPETIRRSGGFARPWLGGFALAIAVCLPAYVRADEPPKLALHELVRQSGKATVKVGTIDRSGAAAFRNGCWRSLVDMHSVIVGDQQMFAIR